FAFFCAFRGQTFFPIHMIHEPILSKKTNNMKKQNPLISFRGFLPALLCLALVVRADAKLNVVATLPDYAAIAREIGGDKVDVTSLAKPTEDPHFVDARPSFVVKLRTADVLIDGGAELEVGWLPPPLQNARNG